MVKLLIVSIAGISSLILLFFPAAISPNSSRGIANFTNKTAGFAIKPVVLHQPIVSRPGLPVRLKIPSIYVDSPLESVGLTNKGLMDVPKDLTSAAWFNVGPRPGEIGNATIDGHFGWKNGVAAIFNKLHKLRPGDKVYVDDEHGVTTTFVVREYRIYEPTADASTVFGSNDGKSHLNLITCQGEWDEAKQSYPDRLVVFADQVLE